LDINRLISELYQIQSLKIGKFTLKSGDTSPFYIDLRLIPSNPNLFKQVIQIYDDLINNLKYPIGAIAGLISAGIPYATAVCINNSIPLLQIRSNVKDHGTKKIIEGVIPSENKKIVILDDLISTGASKLPAIKALLDLELFVDDIIVLIDRRKVQEPIIFEEKPINVHSYIKLSQIYQEIQNIQLSNIELEEIKSSIHNWMQH